MNRRDVLLAALAAGVPGLSHPQSRVPTVGLLWIEAAKPSPQLAPLLEGLRARGYEPGRSIRIDERFLVEGYAALSQAARRLVAEKPDVIICYGGTATQAARNATATIPIVMIGSSDPVKLGFIKSLAKPGGNITGVTAITSDLSGKRLELLKEAFPQMRRFAVVFSPRSLAERESLRNYEAAAQRMGLQTRAVEVQGKDDLAGVVAGLSKRDVDAIAFVGSTLFRANASQVASAAAKTGLPAIYVDATFAEAGGLMSYGPSLSQYFREAAAYVDKILKGAKPGDLPVEQPTRLDLVINARAAKEQRIELGPALLARADRIVQ